MNDIKPPKDYLGWMSWAEEQTKKGVKQKQCQCCKKWFFPGERHE